MLAGLFVLISVASRGWGVPVLGWSLVCSANYDEPDLLVIDTLDTNYLLFEKSAELMKEGIGRAVIIPVAAGRDPEKPGLVNREIVEVMIRVARFESAELVPFQQKEPITLNVARQVAEHLKGSGVKSVLVVTSGFKSKRIHLAFSKALSGVGVSTSCMPVWGGRNPDNWAESWHGIQTVGLQWVKLWYYRLCVL